MTSAGCARGISFSGAFHTVRAHGEYNYRLNIAQTLLLVFTHDVTESGVPMQLGAFGPRVCFEFISNVTFSLLKKYGGRDRQVYLHNSFSLFVGIRTTVR